jgi:hypothetical protein
MRLAFVLGCLERGRDGVGDYARDLAAGCARAGHPSVLVALRDPFVGDVAAESQEARGATIEALRLPPALPWAECARRTRSWLELKGADVVSLQFVPYALQPKGIILGLERPLADVAAGRRSHVMFHETWIGAHAGASLKDRTIGAVQRVAARRLIAHLVPEVVHTSNAAYVAMLGDAGIAARELPLCGSIPLAPPPPPGWLDAELARAGATVTTDRTLCCAMFGSIPPQWSPEPLFTALREAAATTGRELAVIAIGRLGPGEAAWPGLVRAYAGQVTLCALGPRDAHEVSWLLQSVDLGIAASPWRLIGKSATAAAMLDHGLPVLVPRDDVRFRFAVAEPSDPQLHRIDPPVPARLLAVARRRAPRDGLGRLVDRFLADLQA